MLFKDALWDNSEPLYAPGLQWSSARHARWKAPKRYVDAGYPLRGERLEGHQGDGQDAVRANRCRELTREMMRWWEGREAKMAPNTWSWLIGRYRTDPYSPYKKVTHASRENYDYFLDRLDKAIGHLLIADVNYELIMRTKDAMEAKGRSVDNISKFFNTMRRAVRYGVVLEVPSASRVAEILSQISFQAPAPRNVIVTREQVTAIMEEADHRGMYAFATGLSCQFELCLRAMDVRGEWEPADPLVGGVQSKGKMWVNGLRWDMIDADTATLVKVMSKTRSSNPVPYEFDLTLLPALRDRLVHLGKRSGRMGPVIVSERTGLPYTKYSWGRGFSKIRDHLGLPKDLRAMDLRAGGLSEARQMGADPYQLRDAGQHSSLTMNSRYIRDRSGAANTVIDMRSKR